jgi:hypothetical protein
LFQEGENDSINKPKVSVTGVQPAGKNKCGLFGSISLWKVIKRPQELLKKKKWLTKTLKSCYFA